MGLGVTTHALAYAIANGEEDFESDLDVINKLLIDNGLPAHEEPQGYGAATARAHVSSFPYSMVHYLRRAYAHALTNPGQPVTPVPESERAAGDPLVDEVSCLFDCHLICHSDCEGYYVPIDFEDVLFADEEDGLPGGMLGSSSRLMRELVYVAPYLGITLVDDQLPDTDATALFEAEDEDNPLWRERLVWLTLFENARVSLANNTLITFC
ncbi:hypothetical protein ACFXHA_31255 [Nocardia sp. NPDC059240]|uniref:hypothetical protein n=1 Tax=Nocardia sp. NPDC059240 TaxID=3346786 RepID=UPI0036B0682D